jgi:hypothetical protein
MGTPRSKEMPQSPGRLSMIKPSVWLAISSTMFLISSSVCAWETSREGSIALNPQSGLGIEIIGETPPPVPREEVIVPYPDNSVVLLGEGFDLITGQRKPAYCVTAGLAQTIQFGDKNIYFSEVVDEESLLRKLNVSLSASAKYAGYTGGGNYESSVETKTSTKEINIVAQADLKTFAVTMKVPPSRLNVRSLPIRRHDLTPEAIRLLRDPAEFRRVCGDGYVSQITYGADFYARFRYFNLTFEQKTR